MSVLDYIKQGDIDVIELKHKLNLVLIQTQLFVSLNL